MVSFHHTRPVLLSLAAFIGLAVLHTWPLAAAPSHWSRIDGDGGLNTWAVSWVAHALLHDPSRLFDANIFHPHRQTLAFSEAMIPQAIFALPVVALGGNAVLAYSVSLLAGFALTGWAFCLLTARWTGSWAAGYVAGSLAAFNAFALVNLTHLQFLHTGFLALMLFALDRLIAAPRLRDACWLAAGFVLQALASIYLMVFSMFALTLALLARLAEWRRHAGPLAARLAAAAAIAVVLLLPYLAQYRDVQRSQRFERSAADAEPASWRNYVSTGATVHYTRWSRELSGSPSTSVFPGVVALGLLIAAIADSETRRNRHVRMCAVTAIGCVALSFAPLLPFYPALHAALPPLQSIRAVHRVAQLMLLMLALLAGFGAVAILRRLGGASGSPARAAIAIVILLAVNGEALRAPIGYVWFDGVPKVYDALAAEPTAVIAELPFPMPSQWFLNSPYMVNSTRHWRPMLNGYSGFRPASYEASYNATRGFPSDESIIALHQLGVSHVVVHRRDNYSLPNNDANPYAGVASIQLVASDDEILIYRLRR